MTNEETIYENENTILDETRSDSNKKTAHNEEQPADTSAKGPAWRKAATGMGAGILLGGVASFAFTHAAHAATDDNDENPGGAGTDDNQAWADDSIAVATTVSDDMSFSQAFAAARAEVGPGGAFEWHGGVYGTYTAEEWNNMSAEERDEYNSHFNWNNYHATSDSDDLTQPEPEPEPIDGNSEEHGADQTADIEVVDVDSDDNIPGVADDIVMPADDAVAEVEILGVVHDEETGANVGGIVVDGQEVFLIDVDGGGTFDYIAADLNNDGQITEDEYADISAENISVSQFDTMPGADDMYACNEMETDYVNDDVMA